MIKYLFRKVNLCESAASGGQNPAPPATKNCLRSPALTSALRVHGTSPTCNKMKPNGNNKTAPQSKSNMNTPTIVICAKNTAIRTHTRIRAARMSPPTENCVTSAEHRGCATAHYRRNQQWKRTNNVLRTKSRARACALRGMSLLAI